MIIETILTSISEDGKVNFAPVGVHIPDDTCCFSEAKEVRMFLYSGSDTFANLKGTSEGVINFTDDTLSFVDTALFSRLLPLTPSHLVHPPRMACAKMIWEFTVTHFDDSREPALVKGQILLMEELTGFRGFCRAHGAIIEAAIIATRLPWISPSEIAQSWQHWQEVVAKTGGRREREAFRKLTAYFIQHGISIKEDLL